MAQYAVVKLVSVTKVAGTEVEMVRYTINSGSLYSAFNLPVM